MSLRRRRGSICAPVTQLYIRMPSQTLTVVVPAYNESAVLREFNARLMAVFDSMDMDAAVLYVDDGSRDDTWEIIGISKVQWKLVAAALTLGGNIRVGLEDNFYLDPAGTEMAKGNGPLMEKAVRMARDIGREPMSPEEARVALGIPPLAQQQ